MIDPRLIVCLVLIVTSFGAGWKVEGWRWDAAEKARVEAEHQAYTAAAERLNNAAKSFEDTAANLAKRRTIVEREIRHEIEKPVYRDCLIPVSGIILYNKAGEITGESNDKENKYDWAKIWQIDSHIRSNR